MPEYPRPAMLVPLLAVTSLLCLVASFVWGRSARQRYRVAERLEETSADSDAKALARGDYRKDLHTAVLYAVLAVAAGVWAVTSGDLGASLYLVVAIPAALSIAWAGEFVSHAQAARRRSDLERQALQSIEQGTEAPRRWAERLAPEQLPTLSGFEIGQVYRAGAGLMAGDFYDVFPSSSTRVAAVVGDVSGHGIEPSITAFQAKYLLRVFLRQYRDPAQALEELNAQMSSMDRPEEFISLCVVVFDTEAATVRYASAGHPAAWLWHAREVQGLPATGPLLMLDPEGSYYSREIPLASDDLCLLYTDGLAEARNNGEAFGEERIANILRRDAAVATDVLCKSLLEAARDFAGEITDDVAILAVRRV